MSLASQLCSLAPSPTDPIGNEGRLDITMGYHFYSGSQVRAYLGQYPGNLSSPLILPIDPHCKEASIDYSFKESNDSDDRSKPILRTNSCMLCNFLNLPLTGVCHLPHAVTVFYRSDNSTFQLAEITCSDGVQELPDSKYNDIDARLQTLEER